MTVLISTQFNDSWFIPGGQAQDKRSMDIDQGTYVQFINVNNKIQAIPIRQILPKIRNLAKFIDGLISRLKKKILF